MPLNRAINIRFLAVLVVLVLLLGAGGYGLRKLQFRRGVGALLPRAERAEKAGDLAGAESLLRQYLAFYPADSNASARLALTLDRKAKTPKERMNAFLAIEQALRLAPGRADLRRRAVDVAMDPDLQRYTDATVHQNALLQQSPDDLDLQRKVARCLESDRKYKDAVAAYESVTQKDPTDVDSEVRRANLLRGRLDKRADADKLMDAMVARNKTSPHAYAERARYRQANTLDGAKADLARALELAPDDPEVLAIAAATALADGDLAAARKHAEKGVERAPQDVRMYQLLAGVETAAGRPDEAVAALRRGISALTRREDLQSPVLDLQWYLALALIQAKKPDEARVLIAELRKQEELFPPSLDYLEVRILVDEQRWAEASRLAAKARDLMAGESQQNRLITELDLLIARCSLALGDPERSLVATRRALAIDMASPAARMGQAGALLALGRNDEALLEFRNVTPPTPESLAAIARLVVLATVRVPAAQRRWPEAQRAMDEAELIFARDVRNVRCGERSPSMCCPGV